MRASMHIIKKKTLKEYYALYPSVESACNEWYRLMKANQYSDIVSLRKTFPTADPVANNTLICFNIKGNSYRLIVHIVWGKTVFIRELLTHADYTKKYVKGKRK
jgi:mRNA interferase HigB